MSWGNKKRFISPPQVCERDKWSDNKICRLVCLYKKFPCLWKKNSPSYMDNAARHSAYSNIHQGMDILQITFTEVMIKIREVRRIYISELQKILKARSSGCKYEPPQKWFFILHNFLYEYLDFDETAQLQNAKRSPNFGRIKYANFESMLGWYGITHIQEMKACLPTCSSDCRGTVINFSTKNGTCFHQSSQNLPKLQKNQTAKGLEDSASSCYPEDDDGDIWDEDDSDFVHSKSPSSSLGSPRSTQCRKIPEHISCNSSKARPSLTGHLSSNKSSKRSASLRTDSSSPRVKYCPMKLVHCPHHNSTASPEVCHDFPRSGKSTSITVICEKRTDCRSPRDELTNHDSQCKGSSSIDKEPSTLSCPKSSSIQGFDSNGSLNTSFDKTCDEFEVFAKSVACQLRKMDIESAVIAQNQIQNLLTDQRLHRTSIRPEESAMKNLLLAVQELPSPQDSVTRVRSQVVKPAGSISKHLFSTKPKSWAVTTLNNQIRKEYQNHLCCSFRMKYSIDFKYRGIIIPVTENQLFV